MLRWINYFIPIKCSNFKRVWHVINTKFLFIAPYFLLLPERMKCIATSPIFTTTLFSTDLCTGKMASRRLHFDILCYNERKGIGITRIDS